MPVTFNYTLVSGTYLQLDSITGTFDPNTDLVLNEDTYLSTVYPVRTIINNLVFVNQTNLRSVTMNNLTTITGNSTFKDCTLLQSVTLPSLTTFSGTGTFEGCTAISDFTKINLGTTIDTYPNFTFYGCINIVNVTVPSNITKLGGQPFTGTGLKNLLAQSVNTLLDNGVCFNCTLLETCVLGAVPALNDYGFYFCGSLKSLYINRTTASTFGTNTFTSVPATAYIFVPFSSSSISWPGFPGTVQKLNLPVASVPTYTTTTNTASLNVSASTSGMPGGHIVPYYTYKWFKNAVQQSGTASSFPVTSTLDSTYTVQGVDPLTQESTATSPLSSNVLVGQNFVKIQ